MLEKFKNNDLNYQFEKELRGNILPFWLTYTLDRENKGFYGAISINKSPRNQVERSAVLCARILWTFSKAAKVYGDESYLEVADWAFNYLSTLFWDQQYQGIYWSLDHTGQPVQDRKHTYAQVFSIYGLSAYYQVSGVDKSLAFARQLFELIETHTYDVINKGYIECRARDWTNLADMRLSNKDINSTKSMNTMLHLMESYSALAAVCSDGIIRQKLGELINTFLDHIIDKSSGHQRLFFDGRWNSLSDHISFGHDIETSWLLLESAQILGDPQLIGKTRPICIKMAQAVFDEALGKEGSILYESGPDGYRDLSQQWWAHAEAVVGFYNAYQLSGESHFAEASERVWIYIQDHFIDHKDGDWFKLLDQDGTPILTHNKVGPWECPYHHSRMCFEMIKRLNE